MNFTPSFIKTKGRNGNPIPDVRYAPITAFMRVDLVTFSENQSIQEVINCMLKKKISGAPVLDDNGELVGIISEKDCLKVLIDDGYYNNPLNDRKVKEYMSEDVISLSIHTDIISTAKAFINSNFRRFPVLDDNGKLVGQVSRKHVLKAASKLHSSTWGI